MTDPSFHQLSLFKWTSLGIATLFGVVLLWMISDFKQRVLVALEKGETTIVHARQSVENVNSNMPLIMAEIKQTSRTLKRVADDVELMKRVAGINNENQDRGMRGLALYADELQQLLAEKAEECQATIWKEEIFGSDLKQVETLSEFLVGLNKEMIVAILPLSKSPQEVLFRSCHSGLPRRVPFYIKLDEAEPVLLEAFIREQHAASRDLPAYSSK